jgi:hypothetical protein
MTREEYQRDYAGGYNRKGQSVFVPANVERRDEHEPCFLCGTRAGLPCRHRAA